VNRQGMFKEKAAYDEYDEAVFATYGSRSDLTDEEI